MTRAELIEELAGKFPHLSFRVIEVAVKQIFEYMAQALETGQRIEVRGFGSVALRFRPARLARNPKTGEKVMTGGKYTPRFKAGKDLRKRVNMARQAGVPIESK